ncbi:piggyBac transposable element-derived protein 3-like [Penaeus japonicus]|uniref:piggyBac transposable element-derived protein 3-like n=1 Tax=Penaeus japonicus TaxID=27405 RepID=UPI001C7130CE|nr:piggyBac transposable element-derived protein 3-like [Penaeus japonicus]
MDELSSIPSSTFYGRQLDRVRARDHEFVQEVNLENIDSDVETEEEEADDPVMPTNLLTDTEQVEESYAERATFDASLPLSEDSDTVVLEVADTTVENEEAPQVTARRARANARASTTSWVPPDCNDVTQNYTFLGQNHVFDDDLRQPIEYVRQFLTDDLLDLFVTQSNLYSVQKNPNKPLNVDRNEIEQWLGLCIYFSISKLPNVRMHWSHHLGTMRDVTSTVMSRNRWEYIKSSFHMVDNSTESQGSRENKDRLFKVRPIVDHLREKFHQISMGQELCIDEQMVPFKGRSCLKQYVPSKPHKYGYKFFVLAGKDGMTYDFMPYTGKINPVNDPTVPDLGASSNVVLQLSQIIPSNCNYYMFFDNWFTSLPLFIYFGQEFFSSVQFNEVTITFLLLYQ